MAGSVSCGKNVFKAGKEEKIIAVLGMFYLKRENLLRAPGRHSVCVLLARTVSASA